LLKRKKRKKTMSLDQNATLEQQIAQFNAQLATQAPPQVIDQISQHINRLIESGVEKNALQVGEKAPSFTLPDALGRQISLAGLLQQGPVVVTFYRGEWCPYCNLQLHAYQQVLPQIKELGASLIAISPQTPDHSLSMSEKHELAFPVLSDQGNKVARQFGLVYSVEEDIRTLFKSIGSDIPAFNGDESWEIPVPGTFIISQDGTIRLTYADADYTHRLEPSALLESLRTMSK
jgi:peroxiredoxin